MADRRGIDHGASVAALHERAAETGVSVHAVALAVLSGGPTDELLFED